MQATKRRNRAKRPTWSFSGLTRAEWRVQPDLVKWAQNSLEFRSMMTLLVNDKTQVLDGIGGAPATENRLLGRHEAYEAVRLHLLGLADGTTPEPSDPRTTPTYEPEEQSTTTAESDFLNQD